MRHLLIVSIPGTGKSTIADYLRNKHGFCHYDVECAFRPECTELDNWKSHWVTTEANYDVFFEDFKEELMHRQQDVVMTWGVMWD